ncbi:Monothiol glutaredoxin-s15 protein [Thalictrum thalictroides]|uniref:Monothiol glutaredoxin-s15 protein n=1 Tax=Thalictrum thalictroides TaxID=46969 RepID=A0A7J6VQW3_THATH|nr:Monothiol glutaredoxin-s15 protein [Thalictrum thalictroides]
MARLFSNALLKGIARVPATYSLRPTMSGSSCHHGMRFLTTVTSDSDTHDDFKPTDNLVRSGTTLKDSVEKDVKENPVVIYMKGVLAQPQCGFSALAVRVLSLYQVPLTARNILENPELKTAVKGFSNWPTFPQIFIKGEFIGGSDIVLSMHQTGELKDKLNDVASEVSEEKSE